MIQTGLLITCIGLGNEEILPFVATVFPAAGVEQTRTESFSLLVKLGLGDGRVENRNELLDLVWPSLFFR